MKKNLFYAGALMTAIVFSACSKNDVPSVSAEGNDAQSLSLTLSPKGNNSRAGRPLLSSAAIQDIDNVTLYVVDSNNKLVLKKVVGEGTWSNAMDYAEGGHGKEILVSFKGSDKQALEKNDNEYTIYAVGYTRTSDSDYDFTPATPDKVEYSTFNETGHTDWKAEDFKAKLKKDAGTIGEEVFAGSVAVKVVEENGKTVLKAKDKTGDKYTSEPNLMLYRQVAGVTGYFTSIPVYPAGDKRVTRYVRLVASNLNSAVLFQELNNSSAVTQTDAKKAKYVVNGADRFAAYDAEFQDGTPGYIVYNIDINEFFPNGADKSDLAGKLKNEGKANGELQFNDKDGYIDHYDVMKHLFDKGYKTKESQEALKPFQYKDFWKNPVCWNPAGTEVMPYPQTLVRGSVFGAEFVIPFNRTDHKTFELQLLDKDRAILKTYNVNIPASDVHKAAETELATGTILDTKFDLSNSVYSVYRNHMYSMGEKANNTTPDPIDPTDPVEPTDPETPDPEVPEGLNGGQDLLIKVNDNWEIIHKMEID